MIYIAGIDLCTTNRTHGNTYITKQGPTYKNIFFNLTLDITENFELAPDIQNPDSWALVI